MKPRVSWLLVVQLPLLLQAAELWAQTPEEIAQAEVAFREGRQLLDQGETAAACSKFELSRKLDSGTGTLLNLGDCYERLGRTASAWGAFTEAVSTAQRAHDAEGEAEAQRRALALETRVPKVRLVIAKQPPGMQLELKRDEDIVIAAELTQAPLPLDPGEHHFLATATGYRPFAARVTLPASAEIVELRVPALEPEPAPAPPKPLTASKPLPARAQTKPRSWVLPAVFGGTALVGVGVSTWFGLRAIAKKDEAYEQGCEDLAGKPVCYSDTGYNSYNDAWTASWVSTVAGGVGLLSGVAAAYFYLRPVGKEPVSTAQLDVSPTPGGAQVNLRLGL